jgi:hypothetical protein
MLGMFGNQGRPNPFAIPETPAFSPTVAPQAPAMGSVGLGMNAPAPVQQPHGFNAPGGWADKLGGLGALLLSAGGNPAGPQMFDQIQQRRAEALRRQQLEQARYAPQHVGDAIIHLDPATGQYVTDYAPQQAPHMGALETNYSFLKGIDPTMATQYLQTQSDPAQIVSNGDGTFTPVRHSQMYGATPKPAPPGVTFTPIAGGAPSQGGATFSRLPRRAR